MAEKQVDPPLVVEHRMLRLLNAWSNMACEELIWGWRFQQGDTRNQPTSLVYAGLIGRSNKKGTSRPCLLDLP